MLRQRDLNALASQRVWSLRDEDTSYVCKEV